MAETTKPKTMFVKGAYLWVGLPDELSEGEFIKRAGLNNLKKYGSLPFVTLVLDNPKKPFLIGHRVGNLISANMMGRKKWQTMEWRK